MASKVYESFDRVTETCVSTMLDFERKTEDIFIRLQERGERFLNDVHELIKKSEEEAKQNAEKTKAAKSGRQRKKKNDSPEQTDTPRDEVKFASTVLSTGKPKRMASQVASVMISKCANLSDQTKLRRPSDGEDLLAKFKLNAVAEVVVKMEKDLEAENLLHSTHEQELQEKETENTMRPPAVPIKKKGRPRKIKLEAESSDTDGESYSNRSTRSKKVQTLKVPVSQPVRSSRRKKKVDSDIILLPGEPIPVIELLDSSTEDSAINSTQEENVLHSEEKRSDDEEKLSENKNVELIQNEDKNNKKTPSSEKETEEEILEKENSLPKENAKKSTIILTENPEDKKRQQRDSYSSEEENKRAKKRTKKAPRTKTTKKVNKKPLISIENIKKEKIIELSMPQNVETVTIPETTKVADQTYQILNETTSKPADATFVSTNLNATYCTIPIPSFNGTKKSKSPAKTTKNKQNLPVIEDLELPTKKVEDNVITNDTSKTTPVKIIECSVSLMRDDKMIKKTTDDTPEHLKQLKVSIEKIDDVLKLIEKTQEKQNDDKETHWKKPEEKLEPQPQLTDDDSDISPLKKTPDNKPVETVTSSEKEEPKQKTKKGTKSKAMFSPYAGSPVRKRVAAFEKLGSVTKIAQTTRVTRTKTKKLLEDKESDIKSKLPAPPKPQKYTTPLGINKLKSMAPHSDLKPWKAGTTKTQNQVDSTKSQSALKLTRTEHIEKLEKKEESAQQKKEALMHAKMEESKRQREEKMQKAQRVREEKERLKEEKLRQILAEKEERQKEEAEKKRAHLAWKAAEHEEQRKLVEYNRLQKQKELQRQKEREEEERRQQYRKYKEEKEKKYKKKAPPLPTPNDFDSDSDSSTHRKKQAVPDWGHKSQYFHVLKDMAAIPKSVHNIFFSVKPITPDLEEIFESIPKSYLKRNSSAVWRTPPRYSMLPK